jgi:hypothetical protein
MKQIVFGLVAVVALSGCAAKVVEQQIAAQQQALFMVGAKVLELEAIVKPEKASVINAALSRGEVQIDPPDIKHDKQTNSKED